MAVEPHQNIRHNEKVVSTVDLRVHYPVDRVLRAGTHGRVLGLADTDNKRQYLVKWEGKSWPTAVWDMQIKRRSDIMSEIWERVEDVPLDDDDRLTLPAMQRWINEGKGVAVYENVALDSSGLGTLMAMSYGTPEAQLETDEPPDRCPDIGNQINWKLRLKGVVKPHGRT